MEFKALETNPAVCVNKMIIRQPMVWCILIIMNVHN